MNVNGELLSQGQSHQIYRDSARSGDNKAILEHIGTRAFVVKVPGTPAYGERRITPYTSFIAADDGSLETNYRSTLSDAYTSAIPIPERIRYNQN